MYSTDMLVYAQEHCGWNALCKSFFSENIHKCNNDSTIMVCECVCMQRETVEFVQCKIYEFMAPYGFVKC